MADLGALAALAASRSSGPSLTPLPPRTQGGAGDVQAMLARLQQVRAARPALDLSVAHSKKTSGHHKSRGLLTQLRDAVVNVPMGVGHLGAALGKELISDTPILRHHVHFKPDEMLTTQLGQSFQSTGQDVLHPTRFAQAVRQGRIVDKLLEDVGNASIVGGLAGKALTAGGLAADSAALTRAGSIVDRAAHLGGEAANAPVSIPRAALTGLTDRGLPALGRIPLGAVDEALGRRRRLGEISPTTFTEHGREAMKLIKGTSRQAERDAAAVLRTGYKEETAQGRHLGNPSPAEQAAATAIVSGQADIGRLAAERGASPEMIQRVLAPQNVPESHLTPEGAQVAQEFLADPRTQPRAQRLTERIGSIQEQRTRAALEPDSGQILNPEQVSSHDPLSAKVDEFNQTWDKQIADARRLDPRLAREIEQEREAAFQQFLDNPDNYPSRWRDRMIEAQQFAMAGIDMPTRPPELAAAGVLPEYLPSGRSGLTRPKASKLEMVAGNEGTPGSFMLSAEKHKGTAGHYGLYSLRTLFDRWAADTKTATLRQGYRELTDTEGRFATNAAKVLGPDVMDQIGQEAAAEAERMHPYGGREVGVEADRIRGDKIRDAMRQQGYEAWATQGDALAPIPAAQITADSPFLHAGMKKALAKQWVPKDLPLPAKALEAINKKFKGAVLPWSIRWQLGDAISNAMLSWVAGGVNPVDLIASMKRLHKVTPEVEALLDARVQDVGLTNSEREWQHALPSRENAKFTEHPIKALQRPGYRLNSTINRVERHAFYLEKLDRMLSKEGITLHEAGAQVAAGTESPKITAAIDKAVQQANDVLGAFDEMSPFERRWMRNVFPFYPWMRHITVLSARLAIDNPVRAMWVMRVGSIGADPNSELPGYLRGAIHTPAGTFDSNFLNPFADATGQSPLSPEGAFRAMSPGLKLGAAALTGADLNRGGLQLSRPFNTSRKDDFGRQGFNPLLLPGRWDELAYLAANQIPQGRVLMNVAPKVKIGDVNLGPVKRYGQGSMLKRGNTEEPIPGDPRLQALMSLVSIPQPQSDQSIQSILRSIRRRKG